MRHGSLEEHLQRLNAAWPLNTDLKPVHLSLYKPWKRDCHEDDRFMIVTQFIVEQGFVNSTTIEI